MRKSTVLGATLLLAVGLGAGLTGPAAALPVTYPDSDRSGGSHHDRDGRGHDRRGGGDDWDSRVGGHWDGGSGYYDGKRYDWPEDTRSFDGNVCPDMDLAKTDVSGDRETITLIAPEGKLISAYCVKSGSRHQDLGPKIVELDEPVARITIAYPVEGKCKAISHYAVAYVDEPTSTPSPTPSPTPSTVPPVEPSPEPSEPVTPEPEPEPSEPVPPVDTEPSPGPDTPDEGDDSEVVPPAEASPSPTVAPEGGDADAGPVTRTVIEADGSGTVDQTGQLAMTGPQIAALVLAALALVGVGVGAVMASRRRREAQA